MMRKIMVLITVGVILMSSSAVFANTRYGTGVNIEEHTPISAIMDDPESFRGKTVVVQGLVVNVCAARGCWMELAGDRDYETLRIKVEDGVMVFPMTARGKKAVVQGKVEAIPLCADEIQQIRRRMEAAGKKDASVPAVALTIRATGALID